MKRGSSLRLNALACMTLVITTACGDAKRTPTGPGNPVDVYTPGLVFSPFSVTIRTGGTVRFNITGVEHNVIFDRSAAGAPADINVVTNSVHSRTFNLRGTFPYDCTVHPGMSGQVVVQ